MLNVAVCSSGGRLQTAAQKLETSTAEIIELKADLATTEGVKSLWDQVAALGRTFDVAGINAGIGVGGLFAETDLETEIKMVESNCTGTIHFAKHVVHEMLEQGGGKILFTASIAGEMVAPREAVYAATKAFVLSVAHSLRYELRDTEISVTALQPGPTDTDFFIAQGWTIPRSVPVVKRKASPATSPDKASMLFWWVMTMCMQLPSRLGWKASLQTWSPARSRELCTRRWPNQRKMAGASTEAHGEGDACLY